LDYDAKRKEVLNLWEDMFKLCTQMVKKAKAGKIELKASLLKEINQFLRLSIDVIDRGAEEEEERRRIEDAAIDEDDLPTFDDDAEDLGRDGDVSPMAQRMKVDTLEF
jgi:hypothetical protein